MAERFKALVLKTSIDQTIVGSNPTHARLEKQGVLAQMVERLICTEKVKGSIPLNSIHFLPLGFHWGTGFLEKGLRVLSIVPLIRVALYIRIAL